MPQSGAPKKDLFDSCSKAGCSELTITQANVNKVEDCVIRIENSVVTISNNVSALAQSVTDFKETLIGKTGNNGRMGSIETRIKALETHYNYQQGFAKGRAAVISICVLAGWELLKNGTVIIAKLLKVIP